MKNYTKIAEGLDVLPLALALNRQPELFGRNGERKNADGSPHAGMTDIWVRYNDRTPFDAGARPWMQFNDPHDAIWYPEADAIPEVFDIVYDVMRLARGDHLGGVLITKLAPGAKIAPHTDAGWHAEVHAKYFVPLQSEPGAVFGFPDGEIHATPGEVWRFRNDVPHWVSNDSAVDRIGMIVCVRDRWNRQ